MTRYSLFEIELTLGAREFLSITLLPFGNPALFLRKLASMKNISRANRFVNKIYTKVSKNW